MWSEWLARTLKRPRSGEASPTRADAAVIATDENGVDAMRPVAREVVRAAHKEEGTSVAAEL
jgi:hypothetical protein